MNDSQYDKKKFIAKTVTDIGKAIFVVGFASYFYERFPIGWRIIISIINVMLIFSGIIMYPEKRGE